MPKQKLKTHKGSAKRFKISASGKISRLRAGLNHLKQKKSAARKRHSNTPAQVKGAIKANVKRVIGGRK
ncbi:MAG TPA: 50S ribosomal protein L35 [Candidatus Saccharimonadales bacterium]